MIDRPVSWERHSWKDVVVAYLAAAFVFPLILVALTVAGAVFLWLLGVVAARYYG